MGLFCMHLPVPNHANGETLGYIASIKGNLKIYLDYHCSPDMAYLKDLALDDLIFILRKNDTFNIRKTAKLSKEELIEKCQCMVTYIDQLYEKIFQTKETYIFDKEKITTSRIFQSQLDSMKWLQYDI